MRVVAIRLIALFATVLFNAYGGSYTIKSPDGQAEVILDCAATGLSYELSWKGEPVLKRSRIALVEEAGYQVMGVHEKEIDEVWNPVWGQFSEVRDHCSQLTLTLEISGIRVDLICRVYDGGVGMRFFAPAQAELSQKEVSFHVGYKPATDFAGYFPNGEQMPLGPLRLSEWSAEETAQEKGFHMPAVFEVEDGRFIGILESDLYSASWFKSSRIEMENGSLFNESKATAGNEDLLTPWRVILLGESPGDLLVSNVALNLAAPCELEDTSWIKPGKGLWDWRIHGYDNGDFVYGVDTRSYLRLIDFASEQGIEYLTIDDHWFLSAEGGDMTVDPKVDIGKVVDYADERNVGIILYYDRRKGDFGDDKLFSYYRSLGSSGMKYGFMNDNAAFTRNAIEQAGAEKQLVFFHDSPTPMTGVRRTLPNFVTREYCHAQQDSRRAFSPESFLKMAMINALSGPLDQANGNFGIRSINAGERMKGPLKMDTYVSTVVSEVARALVIFSGLVTLPDAPEEYLKKADLFEFLKQMPATWDESRVINSKMGEYITTARRTGDTWFVGSVNNETPRQLRIELGFLNKGIDYEATVFQDSVDSHGVDNPEAYEVSSRSVLANDVIMAKVAMGGGHAMILRPR